MKKISRYLIVIIAVSLAIVSVWIYIRYVYEEPEVVMTFFVEEGPIEEIVRARGKVVSQKEFDLSFTSAGTINEIFVEEGQEVEDGTILMSLDTTDTALELNRQVAVLAQRQATLSQLLAGATTEEIQVLSTKVDAAQQALDDAQKQLTETEEKADVNLETAEDDVVNAQAILDSTTEKAEADTADVYGDVVGTLEDAYVKADDAVHQETEELFTNDDTSSPDLSFLVTNSAMKTDLERSRVVVGGTLDDFDALLDSLDESDYDTLADAMSEAHEYLDEIQTFLSDMAEILNSTISLSDSTVELYKTDVNTGRTNVNLAISNITTLEQTINVQDASNNISITTAETTYNQAMNALATQEIVNRNVITTAEANVNSLESALALAQSELALEKAGTRSEEIAVARAAVLEVQNQIASTQEEISDSMLYAPMAGIVTSVHYEKNEVFQLGNTALSFSADGYKIESDISELDIGKISENEGQSVSIILDSYPDKTLQGTVVSVDQEEIIRDSDTYYRVNIFLDEDEALIRSGMSGDILISTSSVENVLYLPSFIIHEKNGQSFVYILGEGSAEDKKVDVLTGVSGTEMTEIISGLSFGQEIIVKAK